MKHTPTTTPDIIIFGGTFDPPHQGHVECVETVARRFPHAQIYIIPAPAPAGSAGLHKTPHLEFHTRLQLSKIAFEPIGPQIVVSNIEEELPKPNYSLQTVETIKSLHQGKSISLLVGQDQLASFDKWKCPKEILMMASLIVIKRRAQEGQETGENSAKLDALFKDLAKNLETPYQWVQEGELAYFPDLQSSVHLIDAAICEASSTKIRQLLAKGVTPKKDWLPAEVAREIKNKHLY